MIKFLTERWRSFVYAATGLGFALNTQPNARIHLLATIAVVIIGFILGLARQEWVWVLVAIALVWLAELLNSAIEHICDVVSPEHSDAVKHAKDVAAGAVLVCAIIAAIIGLIVFQPYITPLFQTS